MTQYLGVLTSDQVLPVPIPVAQGGTGGTTQSAALTALGGLSSATAASTYLTIAVAASTYLTHASQIYTAATNQLTSASPYRSYGNSATAMAINVPTSPASDETRVFSNVGAGTLTVNYTGRAGAVAKAVAQDNAITMAYNATLGYWTLE